jgi:hypothetical protein
MTYLYKANILLNWIGEAINIILISNKNRNLFWNGFEESHILEK